MSTWQRSYTGPAADHLRADYAAVGAQLLRDWAAHPEVQIDHATRATTRYRLKTGRASHYLLATIAWALGWRLEVRLVARTRNVPQDEAEQGGLRVPPTSTCTGTVTTDGDLPAADRRDAILPSRAPVTASGESPSPSPRRCPGTGRAPTRGDQR